jgi:hypothetical protein
MVLYHANGRVVKKHDDYLEQEAAKYANANHYEEQIEHCKRHDPKAVEMKQSVHIIVDSQIYYTLYVDDRGGALWEEIPGFATQRSDPIPAGGLDRSTLMKCSSLADDIFRYKPDATELVLPVKYPRRHCSGANTYAQFASYYRGLMPPEDPPFPHLKYEYRSDNQVAHIRADEIIDYIVPWLRKMERAFQAAEDERKSSPTPEETEDDPAQNVQYRIPKETKMDIPPELVNKIHLYNAMLQLGLPTFVQKPVVDSLVAHMYRTNLNACELETLEMTVGRFYSQGVPVLDPVLCHFVGTYPLRTLQDRHISRQQADAPPKGETGKTGKATTEGIETHWNLEPDFDFSESDRRLLDFAEYRGGRRDFPDDTFVLPPKLPVLGHSIRHWSGIRRNGSTAAAHTGLPLNIGRVLKYHRRSPRDRIYPKPRDDHPGPDSKKRKRSEAEDETNDHLEETNDPEVEEAEKDPYSDDIVTKHYAEYATHRLARLEHFQRHPPGSALPPQEPEPTKTGPAPSQST